MKRLWPVVKWVLIVWGIFCFLGVLVIGGLSIRMMSLDGESSEPASKRDVRFVLNSCRLGDERIEEVIHSYVSSRSFNGDHLDAHAIRITHVSPSELTRDDFGGIWTRGDQVEGALDDAMKFVEMWLHRDEISWFPGRDELRSDQVFAYPLNIYFYRSEPSAVKLIFVRPADKMVFFFSGKI